jgi:hypothetical protein
MAGIVGGNDELLGKSLDIAHLVARGGEVPPMSTGIAGARSRATSEEELPLEGKILANYFQSKGIPVKVGIAGALEELKQGLRMYRQSKTILAIKKLNPTTAQVHFFTLDDEDTFNRLVKFWMDKLKEAGGNLIYDSEIEPNIVKALQEAGVRLQQSDNPKYKLMGYL